MAKLGFPWSVRKVMEMTLPQYESLRLHSRRKFNHQWYRVDNYTVLAGFYHRSPKLIVNLVLTPYEANE